MTDLTQILSRIESGDASAAETLLPLVYEELRTLAAHKMAGESPDHTLQATALVHEAYIRLVGTDDVQRWDSRGHFFAAAAEAMRRILVDRARRERTTKRGGNLNCVELSAEIGFEDKQAIDILALNDALTELEAKEPIKAELVKLRFFAGLTRDEAASALGISSTTADRHWAYARLWLYQRIDQTDYFE